MFHLFFVTAHIRTQGSPLQTGRCHEVGLQTAVFEIVMCKNRIFVFGRLV